MPADSRRHRRAHSTRSVLQLVEEPHRAAWRRWSRSASTAFVLFAVVLAASCGSKQEEPAAEAESTRFVSLPDSVTRDWVVYEDTLGRFRFLYPPEFGPFAEGSGSGSRERLAALRPMGFAALGRASGVFRGGEVVLTRGPILMDYSAAGGLRDYFGRDGFPDSIEKVLNARLTPITPENLCRLLGDTEPFLLDSLGLTHLSPDLRGWLVRLHRDDHENPVVHYCERMDRIVVFHETSGEDSPSEPDRHVYGAVHFLAGEYSSFQFVVMSSHSPLPFELGQIVWMLRSFEPLPSGRS